jgi:hypothetical protein
MCHLTDVYVVYITYHVDVGETPFLIAVDYSKKSIVLSIRGTLSLQVKTMKKKICWWGNKMSFQLLFQISFKWLDRQIGKFPTEIKFWMFVLFISWNIWFTFTFLML